MTWLNFIIFEQIRLFYILIANCVVVSGMFLHTRFLGFREKNLVNLCNDMSDPTPYRNIKSRVKFNNTLSNEFSSYVGIRQGECLSPFLFSMYINDLESELMQNGVA